MRDGKLLRMPRHRGRATPPAILPHPLHRRAGRAHRRPMSAGQALACDIAVIGGGPAGIAAATRAAENGARVIIIDSGLQLGGQIWRHYELATLPKMARRWLARLRATSVQSLLQSTAVDG